MVIITLWPLLPTGNFFGNWISIYYYFISFDVINIDYDEDIKDSACGFFIRDISARKIRHTVCYKNGVEGIGWRIPVSTRPKNTLATKGSMYPETV